MSLVNRLLEQLKVRGLRIERGDREGVLLLHGPDEEKTPEVLAALKKFKPELLNLYAPPGEAAQDDTPEEGTADESPDVLPFPVACRLCGADVSDPQTRERMKDPAFCDRGGARAVRDKGGNVVREPVERCPYKESA
jgi:hypothetical protein